MSLAVELVGKRIRVLARADGKLVSLEVANLFDPSYEKPVLMIADEHSLEKEAEALIQEFSALVREAVKQIRKKSL